MSSYYFRAMVHFCVSYKVVDVSTCSFAHLCVSINDIYTGGGQVAPIKMVYLDRNGYK